MIAHHISPAGDWETITRRPHPALAPLVRRGYIGYVERAGAPLRRLQVPHEAITMVINLGPSIALDGWGQRRSFVAGLHDRAVVTEHGGDQLGIQLDLTPLGARMLFGLPMRELARSVVDLDALLPAEVVERLALTPDWAGRFDTLDALLLGRIGRASPPRPDVAFAWSRLTATHGAVGVAQLSAELGCSRRHLSARFGEEVGLGPKSVGRILRFRRVLGLLAREGGAARLAEVAAAGGYFDQPHLNRDFRELAGCTPGEYLARTMPEGRGVAG